MKLRSLLTILFLAFLAAISAATADPRTVGACHGRVGDNLPSPSAVVQLLKSNGISKVRLFLPDPAVLPAFNGSGIELMIGVPNENLTYLSSGDASVAVDWLNSNVFSFVAPDQVRYLAVGNEVLYKDPFYVPFVFPAMQNLHAALLKLDLGDKIKLSSPHASSILAVSYPPSAGAFEPSILPAINQMLQFALDTGSPFMVNLYPFISYASDPVNIALSYALSGPNPASVQDGGILYNNLFDATVDAIIAALEREGFPGIPVAVTETGWPTAGHEAATPENAAAYNGKIIERVRNGLVTPRRPDVPVEVYLFDLYNENGKSGAEVEKHFGIFNFDGSKAYNISFAS